MARPREFDLHDALDQAVAVFHRSGYEGASLQDLQDAMGINRASLYAAFGDKRSLFLQAMERYQETGRRDTAQALERGQPVHALRRLFRDLLQVGLNDPRGCLLVNVAAELGCSDSQIHAAVQDGLQGVRQLFLLTLQRAHALGQLPGRSTADLDRSADFLLGVYVGAQALIKAQYDSKSIANFVRESLQRLT